MKENRAFRIPFLTKKQLKSRQALHTIFFKPQYKVYRGVSILYFNASFSDVLSLSKISQPPDQNQQPCPSRLASRLTLTFIRHLTLINSNLIKQKKLAFSFEESLNKSILIVHIANCSVYIICTFSIVIILNIFVCSYRSKLFVIKCFLRTSSGDTQCTCSYRSKLFAIKCFLRTPSGDAQCIWCFTLWSCYMYRILSYIIYVVTK